VLQTVVCASRPAKMVDGMTNKITLDDLKMAKHLLGENCVKILKKHFRLNINGNMIGTLSSSFGKSFNYFDAYHIDRVLIFTFKKIPLLSDLDSGVCSRRVKKKIFIEKSHFFQGKLDIFYLYFTNSTLFKFKRKKAKPTKENSHTI
jgi:hypothetical protein